MLARTVFIEINRKKYTIVVYCLQALCQISNKNINSIASNLLLSKNAISASIGPTLKIKNPKFRFFYVLCVAVSFNIVIL